MFVVCTIQNEWGNTALIAACQWGHADTARILIEKGADVVYRNKVFVDSMVTCLLNCLLNLFTYIHWHI